MIEPAVRRRLRLALPAFLLAAAAAAPARGGSFVNFESPQTRPVALSPGGSILAAVNTADGRVSLFDAANLARLAEVPVGMEPVSLAFRPGSSELWVVNHLSDSVDVVDTAAFAVARTILVGDEPAGIAFTPDGAKAYVTLSAPDRVAVVGAATGAVGPVVPLGPPRSPSRDPRAVVVDGAAGLVYVLKFESGNRTRGAPPPSGDPADPTVIVLDPNLPDDDLVVLSATNDVVVRRAAGVGTILTDLAIHPVTGRIYVTGWDARNLVLGIEELAGHPTINKLAILDANSLAIVSNVDLDGPAPYARSRAVAQPSALAFDGRGRVWVAAQGNDEVVALDPAGARLARLPAGRAPRGLAFDPGTSRLFVFNRLSRDVTVVDTAADAVVATIPVGYAPSPPFMEGRRFIFTAEPSGDGTQACAACHTDAHHDNLVWDVGEAADPKGPMFTQTLRGLAGHAPHHWRGEKTDLTTFNVAFEKLFNGTQLAAEDNQRMAGYMANVAFPPNPIVNRDGMLTSACARCGRELFLGIAPVDCPPPLPGERRQNFPCVACHALPHGSNNAIIPKEILFTHADMKVPATRHMYDKSFYTHGGTDPDLVAFLSHSPPFPPFPQGDKLCMQEFLLQWPTSDHHPAVGTERTANQAVCPGGAMSPELAGTVAFLEVQAGLGNLDVVAAGRLDPHGRVHLLFDPNAAAYLLDRTGPAPVTSQALLAAACAGAASLTFVGAPAGSGARMGRDRDEDAVLNGDEAGIGTDPGNPDTDGDALADGAESGFGTSPTDPDTDGDAVEDGQEVADGTSPTNPASSLRFVSADTVAGGVELTWTTVFNRRYTIQHFDGTGFLTPSDVFGDLFTTPAPEDESPEGTESFVDGSPPLPPGTCRYYEVKALSPGS